MEIKSRALQIRGLFRSYQLRRLHVTCETDTYERLVTNRTVHENHGLLRITLFRSLFNDDVLGGEKCGYRFVMKWCLLTLKKEKFMCLFRSILVSGVFNDTVSTARVTLCARRWLEKY